jgi:hypothetical protein
VVLGQAVVAQRMEVGPAAEARGEGEIWPRNNSKVRSTQAARRIATISSSLSSPRSMPSIAVPT